MGPGQQYRQGLDYGVAALVSLAGLNLPATSRRILASGMRVNASGRWAAHFVTMPPGLPGGDLVLAARVLAGLFLLGERVLHVSRSAAATRDAFLQIAWLACGNADMSRQVKHVIGANGAEAVELVTGARVRFITQSAVTAGGRGYAADCVILDGVSDQFLPWLGPVMAAQPNPQAWQSAPEGAGSWAGRVSYRILLEPWCAPPDQAAAVSRATASTASTAPVSRAFSGSQWPAVLVCKPGLRGRHADRRHGRRGRRMFRTSGRFRGGILAGHPGRVSESGSLNLARRDGGAAR